MLFTAALLVIASLEDEKSYSRMMYEANVSSSITNHLRLSFIEFGRGGGRTLRISQGMNLEVDFLGTLNSFQAFTRYYRENSNEVLSYRCMRTQWALAVNKDSYGRFVLCEQVGPYRESSQRGGGVMVVPQYASCVSYHNGKMAKL